MKLLGAGGQQRRDGWYDYSGTIQTGGNAQLLLPQGKSRSFLFIQNNSSGLLAYQVGVGRAIATISGGKVTSVSVSDAGFGFQLAPQIHFLGGGNNGDPTSFGGTMPDWPTPKQPARGIAVMSASSLGGLQISSITITDPGSGYLSAPYVFVQAAREDPTGVGVPSATVGPQLVTSGDNYVADATTCPTDAISIWGATTGQAFTCKWMT